MGNVRFQKVVKNGKITIEEIYEVVVYRFKVSDAEDPDLYAALPLHEWEHSEQGSFVMSNALSRPIWKRQANISSFQYDYIVIAELEKSKLSEFYLRWGKP